MKKLLNVFAISLLVAAPAFAGWNPFAETAEKAAEAAKECGGHGLPAKPGDMDIAPGVFARAVQWVPESTQGKVLAGAGVLAAGASAVYGGHWLYKKYKGIPAVVKAEEVILAPAVAKGQEAPAQPAEAEAAAPSRWAVLVPSKKAVKITLGSAAALGLYKLGVLDYVKGFDYKALGNTIAGGCKNHWKAIAGTTGSVVAAGGAYVGVPKAAKWYSKRVFVKAVEDKVNAYLAKVDAGTQIEEADKLTIEWIKEIAPACLKKASGDLLYGLEGLFGRPDKKGLINFLNDYTQNGNKKVITQRIGAIKLYIEPR